MRRTFLVSVLIGIMILVPLPTGAYMDSANYRIESDVIGSFGHYGTSASFQLDDTGGEVGTGESASTNYGLGAGFWQTDRLPTISVGASTHDITLGAITGTGKSSLATNRVSLNIFTNSSTGYQLLWQASTAALTDGGANTIDAYTPQTDGVPEHWSVASSAAEWGARLSSASDATDAKWGVDDQSGTNYGTTAKWLNVTAGPSPYQVVAKGSYSGPSGDTEHIDFGAEVGASRLQANAVYTTTVTLTALAL